MVPIEDIESAAAVPLPPLANSLVEWFPAPLLLVAQARRVVAMNSAIERIVAANDGLMLTQSGLHAVRDSDDVRLGDALDAAVGIHRSVRELIPGPQWLVLGRPSGKPPYALQISPLGNAAAAGGALGGGIAAVMIVDYGSPASVSGEVLEGVFGLTRAEASITQCLVSGMSPLECAISRGVTAHSVRAHLNRIYRKTGTRRQAELVAMALRLCVLNGGK